MNSSETSMEIINESEKISVLCMRGEGMSLNDVFLLRPRECVVNHSEECLHICLLNSLDYFHLPGLTRIMSSYTYVLWRSGRQNNWSSIFGIFFNIILFFWDFAIFTPWFIVFGFFLSLFALLLPLETLLLFFYLVECLVSFKVQLNTSLSKNVFLITPSKSNQVLFGCSSFQSDFCSPYFAYQIINAQKAGAMLYLSL